MKIITIHNWLARDVESEKLEPKKVAFRKTGKVHRGLLYQDGWMVAVCSCPGSQRDTLTKGAQVIGEGWEKCNCGN